LLNINKSRRQHYVNDSVRVGIRELLFVVSPIRLREDITARKPFDIEPAENVTGIPNPVDQPSKSFQNCLMSTVIRPALDPDTEALMERILHGKPLDPELYRRIQEQGDRLTEEIRQKIGTVEIAVDLVRQTRDE
jgi:hypothetical protein